jgi:anti-anti-sigma factor
MFSAVVEEIQGLPACRLSGRLDVLTAAQAQQVLDDLVQSGQRDLVVDLAELSYVSSAGLRVLLLAQKMLRKVGGRIIIYRAPEMVRQVFAVSGFLAMFELAEGPEELAERLVGQAAPAASRRLEADGVVMEVIQRPGPPGRLWAHGRPEKLNRAEYVEHDVIALPAGPGLFGAGLGCFGDSFAECRDFFGEALLLEGSLFYQPTVPRAGVEFILNLQAQGGLSYQFLQALTFQGPFQALAAFDCPQGPLELNRLIPALAQALPAPVLGLVLLAESRGLYGMHLKRSPVRENQPDQGREIFHPELFKEWMSFPLEAADPGAVVAGAGLVVGARESAPAALLPWLPSESAFHLHAAIFGKAPLGKRPEQLPAELRRVISEMEPVKVQHLMGRSRLSSGLAGLVALEL